MKDKATNSQKASELYDDENIPKVDLPQDIIPDEVPRKDGPGGERGVSGTPLKSFLNRFRNLEHLRQSFPNFLEVLQC